MSDDRLFASNNAIGRKWYFLNLIILAVIVVATKFGFDDYIFPNVRTEVYELMAQWTLYILYGVYLITFFALVERRLYDICGERDTNQYKNLSAVLQFAVLFQILVVVLPNCEVQLPISNELLQYIAFFFDGIFVFTAFCIGFISGKISNLTYEEYKNQLKYK